MTLMMPTHVTAVETAGVAVMPVVWSERLRGRLAVLGRDRSTLRALREAYEGLPVRVAEEVAGEQVLSSFGTDAPAGWHRQRGDTIADGAPGAFVPGLCIGGPVGEAPVTLSYLPGSARARHDAPILPDLAASVELAPGDVAVLDSRCVRRWSDPQSVFRMSLVRTWIVPEDDARELVTAETLPRLARFAGAAAAPARTVEEWLFERHERRPG